MSFEKAILHEKTKRKPYRKAAQIYFRSCRCHGGCPWCKANRLYPYLRKKEAMDIEEKDWKKM